MNFRPRHFLIGGASLVGALTLALATYVGWTVYELKSRTGSHLKSHPVRQLRYWQGESDVIRYPTREVLDFLWTDNYVNGISEVPKVPDVDDDAFGPFVKDLEAALAEIRPLLGSRLGDKLAAIVPVRGLGSSGYTCDLYDAGGRPVAGFIALDVENLNVTANAWATHKENQPFASDSSFKTKVTAATPPDDTRKTAITLLLLHELGHILAIDTMAYPPIQFDIAARGTMDDYWFARESWSLHNGMILSLFDGDFPNRFRLRFFGDRQGNLPGGQRVSTYQDLEATSFPTLYAATNFADDFAESFANYIHVVRLGRPFQVDVYDGQRKVRSLAPCWDSPRCKAKRDLIERFLTE